MKQIKGGRPNPPPKKKKSFKCYKDNTIKSLSEVECFLNNLQRANWYIRLLNLLKKPWFFLFAFYIVFLVYVSLNSVFSVPSTKNFTLLISVNSVNVFTILLIKLFLEFSFVLS